MSLFNALILPGLTFCELVFIYIPKSQRKLSRLCVPLNFFEMEYPDSIYLSKVNNVNVKHQNNVWNLFKINNKDTRRRSGFFIVNFE